MTSPGNVVDVENRATAKAQYVQSSADNTHRRRLEDINRTLKPAKSLAYIVSEYESKTIARLRETLSRRIAEDEATIAKARESLSAARELELAIPVSNLSELRALRDKILKL